MEPRSWYPHPDHGTVVSSAAPFRGLVFLLLTDPGFRFAPPWALFRRPFQGLKQGLLLGEQVVQPPLGQGPAGWLPYGVAGAHKGGPQRSRRLIA